MVIRNSRREELEEFLKFFKIDKDIIDTCLNREVPFNNYYWKNNNEYLNFKIRFLSIPFWLQLCYGLGIPKTSLIDKENLSLMEKILNISEMEELKFISYQKSIEKIQNIPIIKKKLMDNAPLDNFYLKTIREYPKYNSLRRGNFLIYITCTLSNDYSKIKELSYALINLLICGCILDDLYDIDEDEKNKEENIVIELGLKNELSVPKVKLIFDKAKINISKIIPELNPYLDGLFLKSTMKYFNQKMK